MAKFVLMAEPKDTMESHAHTYTAYENSNMDVRVAARVCLASLACAACLLLLAARPAHTLALSAWVGLPAASVSCLSSPARYDD